MDCHLPFASLAFRDFWLPFELFVTGIAETLGMMFFFRFAIDTLLYHAIKKAFAYKNFVQTGYFRSFYYGRTSYNVYCANFYRNIV